MGIAGPRPLVLNAVRTLVIQLATHHSPDEIKIAAVFPRQEDADWAWMRWLPHVWSDDHRQRFMANDRDGAREMLKTVDDILNHRRQRMSENQSANASGSPFHLVLFLGAPTLVQDEPLVRRVQAEGPALGVFPVFLTDRVKSLPRNCQVAVRLHEGQARLMLLESGASHLFMMDQTPRELADDFARAMAPIRLRKEATTADIPSMTTLLELLGARNVEELDVTERWHSTENAERSLLAPIGMRGGNKASHVRSPRACPWP